jgi:hypothetical protein
MFRALPTTPVKTHYNSNADVYVETNKDKKTFSIVVSNCASFTTPEKINLDGSNITYSSEERTVRLDLTITDADLQIKQLASLLAKLNSESFNNHFYLDRTEFFNSQFKSFVKQYLETALKPAQTKDCNHDHSSGPNVAF